MDTTGGSYLKTFMNGNNPPPYAPQNFNSTAPADAPAPQASTMPMSGPAPMAAPYHQPGPMMNQQPGPMMGQQPMMGQPQGPMMKPPMQMTPHMQMGGPQFPYPGQVYPMPSAITADVTQCSEPNIASCPTCHFVGMTRVERRFATGHTVTGILLMCTLYLVVPGTLILFLCRDYEHICARCNNPIGRKKAFCC